MRRTTTSRKKRSTTNRHSTASDPAFEPETITPAAGSPSSARRLRLTRLQIAVGISRPPPGSCTRCSPLGTARSWAPSTSMSAIAPSATRLPAPTESTQWSLPIGIGARIPSVQAPSAFSSRSSAREALHIEFSIHGSSQWWSASPLRPRLSRAGSSGRWWPKQQWERSSTVPKRAFRGWWTAPPWKPITSASRSA